MLWSKYLLLSNMNVKVIFHCAALFTLPVTSNFDQTLIRIWIHRNTSLIFMHLKENTHTDLLSHLSFNHLQESKNTHTPSPGTYESVSSGAGGSPGWADDKRSNWPPDCKTEDVYGLTSLLEKRGDCIIFFQVTFPRRTARIVCGFKGTLPTWGTHSFSRYSLMVETFLTCFGLTSEKKKKRKK